MLVLVTTNEPLGSLHPAVARPGRCVAEIEFVAFSAEEADEWLERHGRPGNGAARTLASLFGGDAARPRREKSSFGFALR